MSASVGIVTYPNSLIHFTAQPAPPMRHEVGSEIALFSISRC